MDISERGLELIRRFEGFRAFPYYDSARVPTIGYGSTYYPDGQRVRMSDPAITESEARRLMAAVVRGFERGINDALQVEVTQGQFDALVCWSYNVGIRAAQQSTLLRLLNAGDVQGAADQFLRWNKAGGEPMPGLSRRREAEREMFLEDA